MNMKKIILIIMIVVIIVILAFTCYKNKEKKREDIKIPILLYHNFVAKIPDEYEGDFNYINTPKSFEENINTILKEGYTVISMQELYDANKGKSELPEKPILITFDDGYYSNYKYIYPILKKYNIKASIFVVTDNIGKEIDGIKYLGWDECKQMQNSGLVEICSHSKRHVFYNKLSTYEIKKDVVESYKIIENKLGRKSIKVFAYPYGAYNDDTVRVLKNNGIDMQLYDIGINNFKNLNKNYIKRISIPCEMTGNEIIGEIEK